MAEHVTAGEFERWMRHLNEQNKVMTAQNDALLIEVRRTNGRVTALENQRKLDKRFVAGISATIAFVISVGGFILTLIKW